MFSLLSIYDAGLSAPALHPPNPSRLRAATWVRVSTAEQASDGRAGVLRQRDAIASIVASKGYEVVAALELIDVSGTATLFAPETQQLIQLATEGKIDIVLTTEISRIIRPQDYEGFEILDILRRNNVAIDLAGASYDMRSPDGQLATGMMGLVASFERSTLLKRVNQAKEALRARGKNPGSDITLPRGIGYDRKADRYIYTPEIASVIEAFRIIDEEGVRNLTAVAKRTGISPRNVRNLLRLPIYRGERVWDQHRDTNQKCIGPHGRQKDKPKIKRSPDKVIKARVFDASEQAVSDERWFRVQEILRGIRENHEVAVAEKWQGSLLAGTGRCSLCSERLIGKRRSRRLADGTESTGHYICRSHHESATKQPGNRKCAQGWNRKEALDSLTEAFVQRFLGDEDFVAAVLRQARVKRADKVVGIKVGEMIRQKLDDLAKRDQRVLDGAEAGLLDIAEAKQRRERLAEERKQLLATLEGQHSSALDDDADGHAAARISEHLATWPADGSVRVKKAYLQRTFSEIYFRGATITAFRLAPGLVDPKDGNWGAVSNMPVSLDPPVCLTPPAPEVAVPSGHKQCSRCKAVKLLADFYGSRAACKTCSNAASKARYLRNRGQADA